MRKVIKILGSVLSAIVLLSIAFVLLVILLLNAETVQNFAARRASVFISGRLGTTVSVDRIKLRGFSRLSAEGFYVEDFYGDTLIYAETLSASLSKAAVIRRNIVIGDVRLDNGRLFLYQPAEGDINIKQITERIGGGGGGQTNIMLDGVQITNFAFRYRSDRESSQRQNDGGIDWSDMRLKDLNIKSDFVSISGATINMNIRAMSFREASGFEVINLSTTDFLIDDGVLAMDNVNIVTVDSDLKMPTMSLRGNGWPSFSDFINAVTVNVQMNHSRIHTNTLGYFVPGLNKGADLAINDAEFTFKGKVNDFSGTIINLTTGNTNIRGLYSIKNITDFRNAVFDIDIERLTTDSRDIEALIREIGMPPLETTLTEILERAGRIDANIKAAGRLSDMHANLSASSGIGDVSAAMALGLSADGVVNFSGEIGAERLDAGYLIDNQLLGLVSLRGTVYGDIDGRDVSIGGDVGISGIEINKYNYSGIRLYGEYAGKSLSGMLTAADPALKLELAGTVDMSAAIPEYTVALDLGHADLNRMKIRERSGTDILSLKMNANASGNSLDNLNGAIDIYDLSYIIPADTIRSDKITVMGRNTEASKYLSVSSSLADAEFVSAMSYTDIIDYFSSIVYDYLPALAGDKAMLPGNNDGRRAYNFESADYASRITLNIKDIAPLASIFIPGLNVAKGTYAELLFNTRSRVFSLKANSDYVEYDNLLVTKLNLTGENNSSVDSINIKFTTEDFLASKIELPYTGVRLSASNNRVVLTARTINEEKGFGAELDLRTELRRGEYGGLSVNGSFGPSFLMANNQKWNIADGGMAFDNHRLTITNFRLFNNGKGLYVDGTASDSRQDTLRLSIGDLDLATLSGLLPSKLYVINGTVSGHADVISAFQKPLIAGNIFFDNINVNGNCVAPAVLSSNWDFATERAELLMTNRVNGVTIATGFYKPSNGEYYGNANIANIPLAMLEPLLTGVLHNSSGMVDANISVRSVNKRPEISGTLSLRELAATIDATRETYRINNSVINVTNNTATLNQTTIKDSEGNEGTLTASVNLNHFSNISYSARIVPRNMIALNTRERDNNVFFGKVFISGAIDVAGNRAGININAAVNTENNSLFTLSLGGSSSISQADFLTFRSAYNELSIDDIIARKISEYKSSLENRQAADTDVNINVRLNVTPNTTITLRMADNTLNARGTASLNMRLNLRNNEFTLYGGYEILEGDFMMNLQNLASRKFEIERGGTIQWTGSPSDAILNVSAVYRLRASLAPIQSTLNNIRGGNGETTESARIPIECIVRITGNLSRPNFWFEINAPNSDSDTQSLLASAMPTQEDVLMQVFSLLLFNSFLSESDMSNLSSDTSALGVDFILNYVTSLISTDRTRFSLRYRPDIDYSLGGEVDFGLSTEITERWFLVLEGNIDTGPYAQRNANSGVLAGDIALTGLLSRSGNLRMKLFSRPIDRIDEMYGLQESGIGIYYREDFNNVADILQQHRQRAEDRRIRRAERKAKKEGKKSAENNSGDTASEDTPEKLP